jgi:hypothetical protein
MEQQPQNTEDFDIEKIKGDYPDFFEELSPDLLNFISSENASFKIADICLENGVISEEKIEKTAYYIISSLLRQEPEENLIMTLKNGLDINLETAKKISDGVKKNIFHRIFTAEGIEPPTEKNEITNNGTTEEPLKITKKDSYKESIE